MAQITETMVRDVVKEILAQMGQGNGGAPAPAVAAHPAMEMEMRELGEAKVGSAPNEVVIALAPAFGDKLGKWSKVAGAAFAAAGAAAVAYGAVLLKDGVQSAIADAAAQEKLATSLRNTTKATDRNSSGQDFHVSISKKASVPTTNIGSASRGQLRRISRNVSMV